MNFQLGMSENIKYCSFVKACKAFRAYLLYIIFFLKMKLGGTKMKIHTAEIQSPGKTS